MRCFCAVLCLLFCSAAVSSAESPTHWLEIKTEHFTVLTDASERQLRHTAGQLERMHDVFAKLLPNATSDPGSSIVVFALRDRRDFGSLEPAAYLAKGSLDLAGLFLSGKDRSYILLRLDSSGDHPYSVVYHEYTHYMTRNATWLPVWLNEGLAQFYQNTDIFDHEVRLGQPDANQLLFLREQKLLPLQTLFQVDHKSPYYHEENKGNIFYAESWALTHFLFLQDFGKTSRLHTYAQYLTTGETPLAAAQHAFGNLHVLESQFDAYIRHGEYKELTMPLQNAVDEKSLQVTPISAPEADALRADVLVRDDRPTEAEALARAALAQDPQSAEAHESMGLIKLRAGDMTAARKFYGDAVALHSASFLAYYYFGTLSMSDGANAQQQAADSLREAIKRNPRFAPAIESLAQYDAMHHENLDEALRLSLQAVQLEPGNIDYRLAASEVRVERKELPSAISGLQATAKLAQSPEDKARVKSRLEQVQSYQEQESRYETLRAESANAGTVATAAAGAAPLEKPAGTEMTRVSAPASDTFPNTKAIHSIVLKEPDHKLPDGPATGPKHTITGTLKQIGCFYPKGMTLQVVGSGPALTLYTNDMFHIDYTAGNFTPSRDLDPCNDFEGLKATITYGVVEDPTVAGQIFAMELNR